jgi:hypothetical protein
MVTFSALDIPFCSILAAPIAVDGRGVLLWCRFELLPWSAPMTTIFTHSGQSADLQKDGQPLRDHLTQVAEMATAVFSS